MLSVSPYLQVWHKVNNQLKVNKQLTCSKSLLFISDLNNPVVLLPPSVTSRNLSPGGESGSLTSVREAQHAGKNYVRHRVHTLGKAFQQYVLNTCCTHNITSVQTFVTFGCEIRFECDIGRPSNINTKTNISNFTWVTADTAACG